MKKLLWTFMLCQCVSMIYSNAQPYYFENYSSEKGLSQNSCYSIAQDSDGFMWFGTQDGLNRFDGRQFKVYSTENEDGKILPSNTVTALHYHNATRILWVGTYHGLCFYDLQTNKLKNVAAVYPQADTLEKMGVKKIISAGKNEFWIVTRTNGLVLFNTISGSLSYFLGTGNDRKIVTTVALNKHYIIIATQKHLYRALPNKDSYKLEPLLSQYLFPEIKEMIFYEGALWVGTLAGDCYIISDLIEKKIKKISVSNSGVGCFVIDTANKLWIATRGGGIAIYDKNQNLCSLIKNNKFDSRSLAKNFILSLFKDQQNLIWCGGSGGGVAKYDPLKFQFQNIANEPENQLSLADNMVFKLYKSKSKNYYVGTQNKGISEFSTVTKTFSNYISPSNYSTLTNAVYDLAEVGEYLWIATWGGLLQFNQTTKQIVLFDDTTILSSKKLYSLAKLKSSDSLFIAGDNGYAFFSLKEKLWKSLPNNVQSKEEFICRYIFETDDHILWLCTMGEGLVKYNYRKGKMQTIESVKKASRYARHLLKDNNNFWIATDNGVLVFDFKSEKVIREIKLAPNIASNVCYAIEKDDNGFFWVSTNAGLCKIDPATYSVMNYNLDNGLTFLEYNTACTLKEDNGNLWFGGVGGITVFNPIMLKANPYSPKPIINKFEIDNKIFETPLSISYMEKIILAHKQNFFTIYFSVTNFSNSNKNTFRYRLSGIDENWIDCGTRNFASYTKLSPGHYVFQLQSANSNGIFSREVTYLNIIITPPWYQTWWFTLFYISLIVTSVIYFVKRRLSDVRQRAAVKQHISETEIAALKAQMNPHFMFNCINSIDAFIQTNDKYNATLYLNKFAKLIRNVLDSSKQNLVLFTKDIETLKLYIELEELRSETKFITKIEIDEELMSNDYQVPPLIIQPFVENAIIHGLRNREGDGGLLTISILKTESYIVYSIMDNGIGRLAAEKINTGKEKSYGMQMSYDRIRMFNKENLPSVQINDVYENEKSAGTEVIVQLKKC